MSDAKVPPALAFLQWLIDANGYRDPRPLPGGRYAAILPLMFTAAIVTGRIGDAIGFDNRWCYHSYAEAKRALDAWDGSAEPAGWHRHPASGRRLSESDATFDEDANAVPRGAMYVRG